jgi:hypothetical protein
MKIWTYQEALNKILNDLDLQDETFISSDEMIGYFNEGMTEAASEIQSLNQDYFLSKYYVPLVSGTKQYELPDNIFANKIRGIYYQNGSTNYPVNQIRRKDKFENMVLTDEYATDADYSYILVNNIPGQQAKMELFPTSRDSVVYPPQNGSSTPMSMWYIRNVARIPVVGEMCNVEIVAPSQVDATANTIQTNAGTSTFGIKSIGQVGCQPGSVAYITGDAVKLLAGPTGSVPGGVTAGTTYYVRALGSGSIQLHPTKSDAVNNTNVLNITSQGTVFFTINPIATTRMISATLLDVPEFITFILQFVKCKCLEKEGDPRFESAYKILMDQKKQMVDTLGEAIQDDDNEVQADFSYYTELS